MSARAGYKLVLIRLGKEEQEVRITDNGSPGAPSYSLEDCRRLAHQFMGKSPWQHRRPDVWSNGNILLTIRPYYPEVADDETAT